MGAASVRRYWFADRAALEALAEALDPPNWGACALPLTILCGDAFSRDALAGLVGEEPDVRLADPADFAAELDREPATHVQLAFHAVEDFGPALELVFDRLGEADCVTARMFATGRCETVLAEGPPPEGVWIATDLLRAQSGEPTARLDRAIEAATRRLDLPVIAGAVYTGEAGDEAAQWRARAAAAWRELDRLRAERRIRLGREAALKARHERDLARQAEKLRGEIGRLHRAAGLAGRWRARLARWLPGAGRR